jgi:hypothetical protein
MNWQNALMLFFVILTIVTNGYVMQTRLDKIIELLESTIKKKDCKEQEWQR